jgi:phage terminase large subunit-like protein
MRPWQAWANLINSLLAVNDKGLLQYRSGLIGVSRKQGKSQIAASLALWALVFGPPGWGSSLWSPITLHHARLATSRSC